MMDREYPSVLGNFLCIDSGEDRMNFLITEDRPTSLSREQVRTLAKDLNTWLEIDK